MSTTDPELPPGEPERFFPWLKSRSEELWERAPVSRGIYGFQVQPGTRWLPGLTESEIDRFEADLGFPFPAIYRAFLRHMNGTDEKAVNVYGDSGEPYAYAPEYYSYPRDLDTVREYIGWIYESFDVTAEIVDRRLIPHIVPVTGHRFLVADRCEGNPVLSMYGRDTILYAPSLPRFLVNDILSNHVWEHSEEPVSVRFWLDDPPDRPE